MESTAQPAVATERRVPDAALELRWIRIMAGLVGLIALAGLLALFSQGAWAAPSRRTAAAPAGNNRQYAPPPQNPFASNPGGPPAGNQPFFPGDDEEDDLDFNDPNFPNNSAWPNNAGGNRNAGAGNAAPGNAAANAAQATDPSLNMGGGPAGGVISKTKVNPIRVNDETGEGSKEIVTDFNFPDADILDIAKTLGKLTGKNFILDKDVKGRITIISNSPITVGDAWKAFLTALDINGFALIPSGKYVRISRQRDARDKQLRTYTGDFAPDSDALITRVFPLKYIDSEEVARTFRSFMPANSRIIPHDQTNTVIVTDTGSNINKLSKMLEILDVEGYDVGINVIPVKFASAAELSKLIDTLIPGTGGGAGAPGAPRFGGGGGGGRFNARRTKEGGVISAIIADERTNTLIVNANQKGADQVRELVSKLDQKSPAQVGGGRVHVVYLQFAEAEAIANTLNNLSQGASAPRPAGGVGGGPAGGTGVNPVAASLFEGSIKISPDKATNSLVITASPADFVTIQRVINRLDILRDEVYVEVIIMEVAINRGGKFSANIASPNSGLGTVTNTDLSDFLTSPLTATGAILGFKAGQQYTYTGPNNQSVSVSSVNGLVRAIQTSSKANVLATPQITALDNVEATFDSTEKIPYPTSNAVQGAIQASIAKENVSLSIKIKPQINKVSNFVKLDVETTLGDIEDRALPPEVRDKAFATLERKAKTTVVVGDSDTVVLGGLIRDKTNETVNKIPLLGDIPVLGWLFKSKSTTVDKTNLLIFMTPHIIRQYEKIRAILDKKLKQRDDFLEKNTGGEDPLRDARDEMIRNLPDLKDIKNGKPERSVTIDEEAPSPEPAAQPSGQPRASAPGSSGEPAHPGAPVTNGDILPNSVPGGGPAPKGGDTPAAAANPATAPMGRS